MSSAISKLNLKLLDEIVKRISIQFENRIVMLGVNGFCASGKTTIANELAMRIHKTGRDVIRASTDDFQNPPEIRWRKGESSPLGFYRDSINYDSLEEKLLIPLAKNGNRSYRTSTYDIHKLEPNFSEQKIAAPSAILILDGLFLQVPRLRKSWDLVIYIQAEYKTCISRAKKRNQEKMDSTSEIENIYRNRYVKGFQLYQSEINPKNSAEIIIKTD